MVDPLNTKTLTAADLVEIIAHKEQIGIWANEIATAISLGDMLKEDWSFDDSVDLEREIVAQLRDVLSSAFSHPAYDIATLITTQQQEIERLTKEHAASQAVIEVQRQKLDTNAGWEAASAAESRVLSLEETLRRISAIKYPSADTKYALRATIDYARDQARAALKENGQ